MKIRLFCAAGMSTSLLVTKMREAAKAMGIDADIEAAGETRMNEETEGCDVALLGPQIRLQAGRSQKDLRPQGRAGGRHPHGRLRHHERQKSDGVRPQAG